MTEWYQEDVDAALSHFASDGERGLSEDEIAPRQKEHGPNELIETGGRGPWAILWEQLSGPMVILLIAAAVISGFLNEIHDAIVILAIVVINAALGFFQEYRAEKAMAALKQLAVPVVRVRRGGHVREISARDLVPGDVVLLEAGNLVPADGRLIEIQNLKVQEAALTGESVPVEKTAKTLPKEELSLGDRRNTVFMGTTVTYGRGQMLVTNIGMRTELGNIATLLQSVEGDETPLQKRLATLGKQLTVAAIGIVAVVFALGMLQGKDLKLMFLTAISMAVAAVPEGLPAIATVTLALGARRMLRKKALIRRLTAVETLGSVTVICSDKTGTLTENRMVVTQLFAAGERMDFADAKKRENPSKTLENHSALGLLLTVSGLCNDAIIESDDSKDDGDANQAVGDPTEVALVSAADDAGLNKVDLEQSLPRIAELPFESERKRMSTVHQLPDGPGDRDGLFAGILNDLNRLVADSGARQVVFSKGAVDQLLDVCDRHWTADGIQNLDEAARKRFLQENDDLAAEGVRVLGMACRAVTEADIDPSNGDSSIKTDGLEKNLVFLGLCGMMDPPRGEVAEAVARCRSAGIRPIMITGDHPLTAKAIAEELGIGNERPPITGGQLSKMDAAELKDAVKTSAVFARVSPEHKLRIVEALQGQGQIVAMTGDGVNDAPALKRADIGVAMGITGTDVSKEAAEMVLVDDNFATIVGAVEEGRIVYDNIRKFILYTMTSNSGEIWVMLFPAFLSLLSLAAFGEIALPLLPIQILWINLVTDGLPGLALALEPAERNTMARPPHPPGESFFGRGVGWHIVLFGLLMGVVAFAAGMLYWTPEMEGGARTDQDIKTWRTVIFLIITLSQMGHVLSIRSLNDSLFKIGVFSNPLMLAAVALTFVLQMALVYVPPLQDLFYTTALDWPDLLFCLAVSTVVFCGVEAHKWWRRRKGEPLGVAKE